jgi:hypothetical protein
MWRPGFARAALFSFTIVAQKKEERKIIGHPRFSADDASSAVMVFSR